MANSECVSKWKQTILSDLQNDEEIISVLGVDDDEIEEKGLMYNRLFPYSYVYETQDTVKTYICVEISINRQSDYRFRNDLYVRPLIKFRLIAHQDDMRIINMDTYKTRLDYLAELIDKKYNGKSINGSNPLELIMNEPLDISTTYRERVVVFRGISIDKTLCNG